MTTNSHAESQRRYLIRKSGGNVPLLKKGPVGSKGYHKERHICSGCSNEFISVARPDSDPKKPKERFCSRACYSLSIAGTRNPNFKGDRPCRGCANHVMGAQRVFCTPHCRSAHLVAAAAARGPQDRLNRNMRRSVTRFLSRGLKDGRSWRSLTGFSINELMSHLESCFTEGMTWANYGTFWHLDHIKPVAAFRFSRPEDTGFRECWSLANLQPLPALQNLKKNSRYHGHLYRNR